MKLRKKKVKCFVCSTCSYTGQKLGHCGRRGHTPSRCGHGERRKGFFLGDRVTNNVVFGRVGEKRKASW